MEIVLKDIDAEKKIIRERVQLLLKYSFFGHLSLGLELKEDSSLPTMATDGVHLYYNPQFVKNLNSINLRAVIGHEVLHCALGHIWRVGERQQEKWNYACDYAVNLILTKEGFSLPANCLHDKKFEGMSAEAIYAKLPDGKQKGSLMDSHEKWAGNKKDEKKEKSSESDTNGEKKEKSPAEKEKEKAVEREWKERTVRAAVSARMQGKLPGTVEQMVKDIVEPQLDWRIILRDMVISSMTQDFRLIPPAKKHLWRGIYLPSMYGEYVELAIAVDTSGSVSKEEFGEFISEIRGITEQFRDYTIHLFFCDAAVHDRMTLTPHDEWPDAFPKKDGGTNFIPVFKAIEDEGLFPSALVYLTDSQGTFPDMEPVYPVIWILNTNGTVPWGEVIYLEVLKNE